jgi:sugar O-acyltransferase (sialic acid O-acetyltransferase NeuD family)
MTQTQKLIIIGAGHFAVDVADLIEDIPELNVVGFVVNQPPFEHGSTLLGRPIYWIDELLSFDDSYKAVCAIGTTKRKDIINQVEQRGIQFVTVIHPSARVSRRAIIGEGSIISGGAQVTAETKIGRHVIINRGALVGPFTIIEDLAYIAPGAIIAANVKIGSQTWVGLGANILEYLSIGEHCIIGAGSLVTQDVPDRVKVVGMPAMIIEREIEGL